MRNIEFKCHIEELRRCDNEFCESIEAIELYKDVLSLAHKISSKGSYIKDFWDIYYIYMLNVLGYLVN